MRKEKSDPNRKSRKKSQSNALIHTHTCTNDNDDITGDNSYVKQNSKENGKKTKNFIEKKPEKEKKMNRNGCHNHLFFSHRTNDDDDDNDGKLHHHHHQHQQR